MKNLPIGCDITPTVSGKQDAMPVWQAFYGKFLRYMPANGFQQKNNSVKMG